MNTITRKRQTNNRDNTKVRFHVSRIDGRASRGCPELAKGIVNGKHISVHNDRIKCLELHKKHSAWLALYRRFSGKYCPDELEEHRREINEPRRSPERAWEL